MTTQYLEILKESTFIANPGLSTKNINFGNELMVDVLIQEGFFLDESVLNEGIFDIPMTKMKSIVGDITGKLSSKEGTEQIVKKYGKMTSSFSVSDLKNQAVKLAATKGIEEEKVLSFFERIMRALTVGSNLTSVILNPLGWVFIIICLIKSGGIEQFKKNLNDISSELYKSLDTGGGKFEDAVSLGSTAWKLILVCFIPPWIQFVVLMPAAALISLIGFIMFLVQVYKMSKKA